MDKTIGTKLPEEEGETLEKIAAERGESVSGFVRNLVRMAIEKNGKVDGSGEEMRPVPDTKLEEILTLLWRLVEAKPVQNQAQNSDPETAKKIEGLTKLLSGFSAIFDGKSQEILNEIRNMPKPTGGNVGGGIDPDMGKKILKSLTENVEKIGAFEAEIGGGKSGRVSFKNPDFWKKSLAVVGIWSLFFPGIMGWGMWKIYEHGKNAAELMGIGEASPVYNSFYHLMQCDQPGWKVEWSKDGKTLYCDLDRNPLTKKPYKLRIR